MIIITMKRRISAVIARARYPKKMIITRIMLLRRHASRITGLILGLLEKSLWGALRSLVKIFRSFKITKIILLLISQDLKR